MALENKSPLVQLCNDDMADRCDGSICHLVRSSWC